MGLFASYPSLLIWTVILEPSDHYLEFFGRRIRRTRSVELEIISIPKTIRRSRTPYRWPGDDSSSRIAIRPTVVARRIRSRALARSSRATSGSHLSNWPRSRTRVSPARDHASPSHAPGGTLLAGLPIPVLREGATFHHSGLHLVRFSSIERHETRDSSGQARKKRKEGKETKRGIRTKRNLKLPLLSPVSFAPESHVMEKKGSD